MQVEALLCDFAQVHAGKLFISGAGINVLASPAPAAPYPVGVSLALLIRVPWEDTNSTHHLRVGLIDEDGHPVAITEPPPGVEVPPGDRGAILATFQVGRSPMLRTGEETLVPVALPLALALPKLGAYEITIAIDAVEAPRVPFRLVPPAATQPPPPPTPPGPASIPYLGG